MKKLLLSGFLISGFLASSIGLLRAQQVTPNETQLMHYVVQPNTRLGILKSILTTQQDTINMVDPQGDTAFLRLIATPNSQGQHKIKLAQELIKQGADTALVNKNGYGALMLAVERGDAMLVSFLLKENINVQVTNNQGETPLIVAVRLNNRNVAAALLLNSTILASIDSTDNQGKTALFKATEHKSTPLVQLLLDNKANIKTPKQGQFDGKNSLMLAAEENWIEGAKLMLNSDSTSVNSRDNKGQTPLFYAAGLMHWDMIRLLVDKGTDLRAADTQGQIALHHLLARKPWVSPTDDLKGKVMVQKTDWQCYRDMCDRYRETTTCTNSDRFCLVAPGQCVYRCIATDTKRELLPYDPSLTP